MTAKSGSEKLPLLAFCPIHSFAHFVVFLLRAAAVASLMMEKQERTFTEATTVFGCAWENG